MHKLPKMLNPLLRNKNQKIRFYLFIQELALNFLLENPDCFMFYMLQIYNQKLIYLIFI
jgi:hypothetical protein